MSQEANIDLDFFESLESKSRQLFQQFVDHVSKVQEQMQQVGNNKNQRVCFRVPNNYTDVNINN